MAGRRGGTRGSARARGLRTLQHQTLSPNVRRAIDTEVWLRSLLVARAGSDPIDSRWATKDQVHDEALDWFLQTYASAPPRDYPARRAGDEDLTFWIDSRLMERARRMADRDGVKVARLIDAALSGYVREHLPPELLAFRERVTEEAARLYPRSRGSAVPGAAPRRRMNRRT